MPSRQRNRDRLGAVRPVHPHAWLWEPLTEEPTFALRAMFGAKAIYLHGRMVLCFCAREEPWRGVLICTDHEHQHALRTDFPALGPHPILPKWLYLPESHDNFERLALALVELVRARDPRIGITPRPRQSRAGRQPRRLAQLSRR